MDRQCKNFLQLVYADYVKYSLAMVGFSQGLIKTFIFLAYLEETHYAINPPSVAL